MSADYFIELNDKNRWKTQDYLYSNRQKKYEAFEALRVEWRKGDAFADRDERCALASLLARWLAGSLACCSVSCELPACSQPAP